VVIAGRTAAKLEAARREVGDAAEARELDATDERAVLRFFDAVGAVDHLVATAAANLPFGPFAGLDMAAFRQGFDGKFWAFTLALRHALATIRRDGSVTLVTGAAARTASPARPASRRERRHPVDGPRPRARAGPAARQRPFPRPRRDPRLGRDACRGARRDVQPSGRSLPVGRVGTPADLGEAALFLMTNGYTTGSCWTWTAGRGWGARASLAAATTRW
jgi:NAD(P)-dependent dehydrogenase (short-subunit alcohol dehydrogenase family)